MDTTEKPSTACIYTRISRDSTGERIGVDRQLDDCRTMAQRYDLTVDDRLYTEGGHHFDDDDISAFSGKTRPGYEAMLTAIGNREFDAILCYHPDRLYRSMKDLERLIDLTEAANVTIRSVNGGDFDLSTATGKMVARILGSVARQESEHKAERQVSANTSRRAKGRWQAYGLVPFGYTKVGEQRPGGGGFSLVRKEPEATLYQQAAAHVLAGGTLRAICRDWNNLGIPTLRGNRWQAISLRQILTNPVYANLVCAPHERGPGGGPVMSRSNGRSTLAHGDWEPLIDEDTHHALIAVLSDPKRRKALGYERKYMGSGVYRCGECGGVMFAGCANKGVPIYVCKGDEQFGGKGGHVARKLEPVDDIVTAAVMHILESPDIRARLADTAPGTDLDELRTRRAAWVIRADELAAMFAAGDIDAGQLRSGTAALRAKITEADAVLAAALASSPASALLDGDPDALWDRWEATSPDAKGKIIDELMTVVIHKARVKGARFDPESVSITPKR